MADQSTSAHESAAMNSYPVVPATRPVAPQHLMRAEDLFDEQIGLAQLGGQALQVFARVGQAVDVIEAKAIDHAVAHQLENLGVDILEDARPLDIDTNEIGDLEEAAVGQRLTRGSPVR